VPKFGTRHKEKKREGVDVETRINLGEISSTSHDPLSWWAGKVTVTAEDNPEGSSLPCSRLVSPLTPNDLRRSRAVSPLKTKIPSKNMREKPKKYTNYSFSLLIMWRGNLRSPRTTSLNKTRPSTIFYRLLLN
jgi:hypothetical protein